VSTTIIESGLDIPNANTLIVDRADVYGLPQLHQLRGRVGRDRHQSYCFLLYQYPLTEEARERLKAMTDTTDGFEIAERDLLLRGPGDFFGTRQAGVPTFRMIDLVRDRELLDTAQKEAVRWFAKVLPDAAGVERLVAGWEQRFRLVEIG
jgi:ATP-dependent DNA helicase RecG